MNTNVIPFMLQCNMKWCVALDLFCNAAKPWQQQGGAAAIWPHCRREFGVDGRGKDSLR
jgi:hypothetical protein